MIAIWLKVEKSCALNRVRKRSLVNPHQIFHSCNKSTYIPNFSDCSGEKWHLVFTKIWLFHKFCKSVPYRSNWTECNKRRLYNPRISEMGVCLSGSENAWKMENETKTEMKKKTWAAIKNNKDNNLVTSP